MDEIDNIIIHSLRQIGCNLDEDLKSLDDFSASLLVQVVSRCISMIDPSLEDLPKTLPPGMAQRFTATASLAEACRTIGYRRDIGYQTFLYSNVGEVRKVLMFLVERLPKEASDKSATNNGQSMDATSLLETQIQANLQAQLQEPWQPEFCRLPNTTCNESAEEASTASRIVFKSFVPQQLNLPLETEANEVEILALATTNFIVSERNACWSLRKLDHDLVVPTVIAANDGTMKSNASSTSEDGDKGKQEVPPAVQLLRHHHRTLATLEDATSKTGPIAHETNDLSMPSKDVTTINRVTGKSPLESLQEQIESMQMQIEATTGEYYELQGKANETSEYLVKEQAFLGKLEEEKKIKERTHILLEDPEVNLRKLEGIITAAGEKMKKLQTQWKAHRAPLLETLEAHHTKNFDKLRKAQQIIDHIEATHQKCEEVTIDLQTKSAMYVRLQKEFEKLNKTISRTAYTSRILEIIGNIRKQKADIDKILEDTRHLQKEINRISGQLDRQFTVTDDLIFRNAKKDEHSKRAYRLLVTLHSECADLVRLVEETGAIKREIRELEDQCENEKGRNVAANLVQITRDLTEMQRESVRLEETIHRIEQHATR